MNDDKIIAAMRGGNAPDVVSSFTSSNVGIYCPSGGWIDLGPYLKRDKVDIEPVPGRDHLLHAVQGQALRAAAARRLYGFYYNKTLFAEAGINGPPKTHLGADGVREEADEARTPTGRSRSSATTRSSASTRTRRAMISRP